MTKRTIEVVDSDSSLVLDQSILGVAMCSSKEELLLSQAKKEDNDIIAIGEGDGEPTVLHCLFPGCLKEFSSRWSLTRHKRTHTGEKPFKCILCGKEFIQKCSLTRHEQIHTEDKLWICDHLNCDKRFKLKEYLEVHKRTHVPAESEVVSEPVIEQHSEVPENDVTYLIDQLRKRLVRQSVRHHEQLLSFNSREHHTIVSLQECSTALEKMVRYISEHKGMEIIPLEVLLIAQKYSWSGAEE